MEPALLASLALLAGFCALLLERNVLPLGLISGGAGRLPRRIAPAGITTEKLPESAQSALGFLAERLSRSGFRSVDVPSHVHELEGRFRKVYVVPFVHAGERALFLLVMECGLTGAAELMLHIITPLTEGRRVETSTLSALDQLRAPVPISLSVVTDADSVEEIWSRHRRALLAFRREERLEVTAEGWKALAQSVYESWLEVAVRAQRLRVSTDGQSFRIRSTVD